jgi:hypothetical protein
MRNQNVTCSNTISGCIKYDLIAEDSHVSSKKNSLNVHGEVRKNHVNGILEKKGPKTFFHFRTRGGSNIDKARKLLKGAGTSL